MQSNLSSSSNIHKQKILVIGPAWIGDMVMTQSLFKLLKQRNPEVVIDVLASAWNCAVLEFMPEVNQSIIAPFKHGELLLGERYRLAQQLRAQRYDQVIVIPNSFKSALIAFFAGIPKRTGWRGEMRWGLLNDMRYLDKEKLPKFIQRFAALGIARSEKLPIDLPLPALQISSARTNEILKCYGLTVDERPILGLCPGAEYGPARRWPAEYFAEIARTKIQEGWQVWLFGSAKDKQFTSQIQQLTSHACVDLAGETSLSHAIHLLSCVSVVISNDSGLMHLAGALNKPLIVIYGNTPPEIAPPLSKQSKSLYLNLECSPCFERECPLGHFKCLRDLKPEVVLGALRGVEA